MADTPNPAAKKPKLKLPPDAVRMKCVNPECGSTDTRATYQHEHDGTVVTFELPAYTDKKGRVPYNWACPCGEPRVYAVYVECGKCGYIGRVDNKAGRVVHEKRVVPPERKEE